jgi:wobble nucleotide-excising tRNase
MIKRIATLKHLGRFKELHSANGADHDFARLNVVFASNGAGKSTLCDLLRSMSLADPAYVRGRRRLDADCDPEIVVTLEGPKPQPSVRFRDGLWVNAGVSPTIHVYDDRFVAENVLVGHHISVDQRRNLYGLIIGARGIELKRAVDAAEGRLSQASRDVRDAETQLKSLLPVGHTVDTFRSVPAVVDVDHEIEKASEALALAKHTRSKADTIQQRSHLAPVPIALLPPNLWEVLSRSLDHAAFVAEQKVREHLDSHALGLGIDWLLRGYKATISDSCPYCGQSMTSLGILNAFRSFFSVERSVGGDARNQIRTILTSHRTEQAWWSDASRVRFDLPACPALELVVDAHKAVYQAVVAALDRKQANPASPATLTESERKAVDEWEALSATLTGYNDSLRPINVTISRKKAEAGGIDLKPFEQALSNLEASKVRHCQVVVDSYAVFDAAVRAKSEAQRLKQIANDALRDQANGVLSQYGARINDLVDLFAARFRIVCGGSNENYVTFAGGQPSGHLAVEMLGQRIDSSIDTATDPSRPSLANTLSGGDRSTLALAFFLAKVEQEPDLGDCIVVFDDPFHSQDRSRQSRTVERIHALARRAKQVFVFSHDLDFARSVASVYGVHVRTFVLNPLADKTTLECKDLPMLPSRVYEAKYRELAAFVANPSEFDTKLNAIAGTLRTVLEEYLQLKFPLRWTGRDYWFGTMIEAIRDSSDDDPLAQSRRLLDDLASVNEYSQRFHHRTTGAAADVPDARELITYVRQALQIIHQ